MIDAAAGDIIRESVAGSDTYEAVVARLVQRYGRDEAAVIWQAMLRVLSEANDALDWAAHRMAITRDELVAPGVLAWVRDGAEYEIKHVLAIHEGDGSVGRWLDDLAPCRKVVVPNVTSKRLQGILSRRGFRPVNRLTEIGLAEPVWMEIWVRKPTQVAT